MDIDPRIVDLLLRHEEWQAQGLVVTPEQLCVDCPELLDAVKAHLHLLAALAPVLAGRASPVPPATASSCPPTRDSAGVVNPSIPVTAFPPPTRNEAERFAPGTPSTRMSGDSASVSTLVPGESTPPGAPLSSELAEYEILGELGRGGMGVVYKARQLKLQRIVALKMILAGVHADAARKARFRAEAEAIARLQHRNIVQVFDVGEHQGLPFFSLEYCPGGSLARKLNGKPVPAEEAARIVEQLAEGMQAAHEKKLVHRDLKPSNVLLDAGGTPKVTDFGLVKQLDVPGQTRSGTVMGTPEYMAPEQAKGLASEIEPAADIYALGAILYDCLTGRPPFQAATTVDTLMQVVSAEPVPPSQLAAKVPCDLETICLKCLQKEPGRRYPSGRELADDLGRYLRGEPIEARPVGRLERGWRWARRNPMVASLASLVLLLLLVGTTAAWLLAAQADAEAKEALRQKGEAEKALRVSEFEKAKAEFVTYSFQLDAARQALDRGQPDRARDLLRVCDPQLCGWEHNYLLRQTMKLQLDLKGHRGSVHSVAFSPDGKRILSASSDKTLKVWDAQTGQEALSLEGDTLRINSVAFSPDGKRIVSGGWGSPTVKVWDAQTGQEVLSIKGQTSEVSSVAFSSDGKRIVSGGGRTVKVWDAQTGEEVLSIKGHTDIVTSVAFSPDGKRIVLGGAAWANPGEVKVWDAQTANELLSLKGHTLEVSSVAFSPDGKRIVSASGEHLGNKPGEVKVWDAQTGNELLSLKGNQGCRFTNVAFSPDGKRIVSGSSVFQLRGEVKLWDAQTGQEVLSLTGHTSDITSVAFSPDGKRILSGSRDNTVKVWDAQTGREARSLTGHTSVVTSVAFSPDAKRIVLGGGDFDKRGEVKVWDAQTGQETDLFLAGHMRRVTSVGFSPNGKSIVSGSYDKTLKLWDAHTGQEVLTLKGHTGTVFSVAFSPDGKRIVSGSRDKTLIVWDAHTGEDVLSLKGHTNIVTSVAFSPDGKSIVSGGTDKTVKVWDAQTGQEALSLTGHTGEVSSVAFSPNGKSIVSGGWGSSGSEDLDKPGEVKVWDAQTGQEALSLTGHTSSVSSVAFSPDGKRIVSGGTDKTVKVWDALTGKEALSLGGHTGSVSGVAFSPDGKRIVSGGGDRPNPGEVYAWDATLPQNLPGQKP